MRRHDIKFPIIDYASSAGDRETYKPLIKGETAEARPKINEVKSK